MSHPVNFALDLHCLVAAALRRWQLLCLAESFPIETAK